jgi:hypothetical protein
MLALLATMAAKVVVVRHLQDVDFWLARWLGACANDVVVFFALAAVLSLLEHRFRHARFATIPIAVAVATFALLNTGYLSITGEQLRWPTVKLGLDRVEDVWHMGRATLLVHPVWLVMKVVVATAIPFAIAFALRRSGRSQLPAEQRARAAGVGVLAGIVLVVIAPKPTGIALTQLHANAVVTTVYGALRGRHERSGGLFVSYRPRDLVDATAIEQLRTAARPNIIVVVLESTRRDETTLVQSTARARTPNLVALAARGTEMTNARAVMTHTSKSLWSMLCGRLPLLQYTVVETSSKLEVQCLPAILDRAGYRTGFFQSATGIFEDRPRLVRRFGFRDFLASEHISGELVGYLASDDETLLAPVTQWIDKAGSEPFMALLLTSGMHHPYDLSPRLAEHVRQSGGLTATPRDHYDRLIESADALLGGVVAALEQRGLLDKTIIVVVGDHGEGFGDKGARQHGTNFYEEGLHVPWVMAGPGLKHEQIATPVSLVDLAPTLLGLLGVPLSAEAAAAIPSRSVFAPALPHRVMPFSCFNDTACQGFVVDHAKVVQVPESGESFWFDLARDPNESNPQPLTPELAQSLNDLQATFAAHRASKRFLDRDAFDWFPQWKCDAGKVCSARAPMRR